MESRDSFEAFETSLLPEGSGLSLLGEVKSAACLGEASKEIFWGELPEDFVCKENFVGELLEDFVSNDILEGEVFEFDLVGEDVDFKGETGSGFEDDFSGPPVGLAGSLFLGVKK